MLKVFELIYKITNQIVASCLQRKLSYVIGIYKYIIREKDDFYVKTKPKSNIKTKVYFVKDHE